MEEDDFQGEHKDVVARGFLEFDDEDNAGFSLKSIEVKPYIQNDLSFTVAGLNCIIMMTTKNVIVRKKLNPEKEYESISSMKGDFTVKNIYMDLHGYHCFFQTNKKTFWYLNLAMDSPILLSKLKDIDVSAIAFPTNPPSEFTGDLLLGTKSGGIYAYQLHIRNSKIEEETPVKMFEIPHKQIIYGILYENFNLYSKTQDRVGSVTLVMIVTHDSCYQMAGQFPSLFQKYKNERELNKYKKMIPSQNMLDSELRLFHVFQGGKFELHSFVWKSEVGVFHGKFRNPLDVKLPVIVKDFIAEGYQHKEMSKTGKVEIPEAIGITENSIFYLYLDNLTVISKITKEIEYSTRFQIFPKVGGFGEKKLQIFTQQHNTNYYLYKFIIK